MSNPGLAYVAIVDDDESVRRSYGRWIRAAGFITLEYSSAEAFLDDRKRPIFDCLVLDIRLSGMTGLELCRRLRAVQNATPVVFITAIDEPSVRSEAMATDCSGFFLKSDEGSLVLGAIRRATGRETVGPQQKDANLPIP